MGAALATRVLGLGIGALVGWQIGSVASSGSVQTRDSIAGIVIGGALGLGLSPWALQRPYAALRGHVHNMPVGDLLVGLAGLVMGLVVGALLAFPLSFLPWWFGRTLPVAVTVLCAYLGVSLLMVKRRDVGRVLQAQRIHMAEPELSGGQSVIVDTSAIIDGRIADITQTGFLHGTLIVPRFVLSELQHIADSPDPVRRNRGRRGLDILNRLQKDDHTPVEICDVDAPEIVDVDSKLVKLARQMSCPVITNDFNLNRVAELQGVRVMNINQLANALKPVVLPGEEMSVRVIQEGKEYNQGVAYLDDGTMIVVENGRVHLDRDVDVIVTRVLQTVAGRMIFAHPKQDPRL